jgi:hypothetical protein
MSWPPHHLFLVDEDAGGFIENRLQLRQFVGDAAPAGLR